MPKNRNSKKNRPADPKKKIDSQTERLPGDIHFHLKELRTSKGLTQNQAAEEIGVSLSTYKHMENSKDQSVDYTVILKACDLYGVSSDYLLGKTTTEFPTSELVAALGLSEKSLKKLANRKTDREVVNRFIEHPSFYYLAWAVTSYVRDRTYNGIHLNNELLAGGLTAIDAIKKNYPDKEDEIAEDQFFLQNMINPQPGEHDLDRIVKQVSGILHDVRRDIRDAGKEPELLNRNEARDFILSVYMRRQKGDRISFLRMLKELISIMIHKAPLLGVRQGRAENELIVTLPKTPGQILNSYETFIQTACC